MKLPAHDKNIAILYNVVKRCYNSRRILQSAIACGPLQQPATSRPNAGHIAKPYPLYQLLVRRSTLLNTLPYLRTLISNLIPSVKMGDTPLTIPEEVRGMKTLKREQFCKTYQIPALKIPINKIKLLMKSNTGLDLFRRPGIKSIADMDGTDTEAKTHKMLLLNPNKYSSTDCLNDMERKTMEMLEIDVSSLIFLDVYLGYENWNHHEILKSVLPSDSDGVAGFSQIGHIIHLNLKEDLHEYKKIIADVLLDKIKVAKTIVNKTNVIDNTFRNFQMEVLAGEANFITEAKENGVRFQLDFSKVYWNPRLSQEHERIVAQLNRGDVVYDMFAGIGPFSVPAGKKFCIVKANDLNPESFKWLQHNMKLNKVKGEVETFNLDGRDFAKNIIKKDLLKRWSEEPLDDFKIHIIMNLPVLALEFLDVFKGLMADIDRTSFKYFKPPIVHCHCFSKSENPAEEVRDRVEAILDTKLDDKHSVKFVRKVAPNKDMMCISFPLFEHVLFCQIMNEPPEKKIKL